MSTQDATTFITHITYRDIVYKIELFNKENSGELTPLALHENQKKIKALIKHLFKIHEKKAQKDKNSKVPLQMSEQGLLFDPQITNHDFYVQTDATEELAQRTVVLAEQQGVNASTIKAIHAWQALVNLISTNTQANDPHPLKHVPSSPPLKGRARALSGQDQSVTTSSSPRHSANTSSYYGSFTSPSTLTGSANSTSFPTDTPSAAQLRAPSSPPSSSTALPAFSSSQDPLSTRSRSASVSTSEPLEIPPYSTSSQAPRLYASSLTPSTSSSFQTSQDFHKRDIIGYSSSSHDHSLTQSFGVSTTTDRTTQFSAQSSIPSTSPAEYTITPLQQGMSKSSSSASSTSSAPPNTHPATMPLQSITGHPPLSLQLVATPLKSISPTSKRAGDHFDSSLAKPTTKKQKIQFEEPKWFKKLSPRKKRRIIFNLSYYFPFSHWEYALYQRLRKKDKFPCSFARKHLLPHYEKQCNQLTQTLISYYMHKEAEEIYCELHLRYFNEEWDREVTIREKIKQFINTYGKELPADLTKPIKELRPRDYSTLRKQNRDFVKKLMEWLDNLDKELK